MKPKDKTKTKPKLTHETKKDFFPLILWVFLPKCIT